MCTVHQFWLTMSYLSKMTEEQTLVMYSGHPLGLFPSSPCVPRLIITNGMVSLGPQACGLPGAQPGKGGAVGKEEIQANTEPLTFCFFPGYSQLLLQDRV